MISKKCKRKRSWHSVRHCPSIFLKRPWTITKALIQNSRLADRELNPRPPAAYSTVMFGESHIKAFLRSVFLNEELLQKKNVIEACTVSRHSDGLRAGQPRFDSRQEQESFLYFTASRPALGPIQSPIQWVPAAIFSGLKRTRREVDHSSPSSAEVNNGGAIPPLPYVFMARCLIN
jgi:hypothetical protein